MWILLSLSVVLGLVAAAAVGRLPRILLPERLLPTATAGSFLAVFNALVWLLVNTDAERTRVWLFVYLPSSVLIALLVGNYTRRKLSLV